LCRAGRPERVCHDEAVGATFEPVTADAPYTSADCAGEQPVPCGNAGFCGKIAAAP
jgi:hypothetical protein